jgi:hypothetical protein
MLATALCLYTALLLVELMLTTASRLNSAPAERMLWPCLSTAPRGPPERPQSYASPAHQGIEISRGHALQQAYDERAEEGARETVQPTDNVLLTEHRAKEAALRFLKTAIGRNGLLKTITIDWSDADETASKSYNQEDGTTITIRQVKYLNNVVDQDHRAVKRVTRPMLGVKSFEAAQNTLTGIEPIHMIKKRQLMGKVGQDGLSNQWC